MEPLKDSYKKASKLKTETPGEQCRRQRISNDWEPNGFKRYTYNKALLGVMPVIGGPDDQYGGNPDRYQPVSPTMEVEFPIGGQGKEEKKSPKRK